MKIATVFGTRPEIIRLSRVIPKLDAVCEHTLIHTGQNFDVNLKDIFFDELKVRAPDYYLAAQGSFARQVGQIFEKTEDILLRVRPDRLLILGDTNSGLVAFIAKRLGIRIFHMEAGNRCYDDRVPEEVNRRVIDHSSDILLPYTERSRANLLAEGIPGRRILVTGNPIFEVINHYRPAIDRSSILQKLGLAPGGFFLVTVHRAENVDVESRLRSLVQAFDQLEQRHEKPLVISTHPRTRARIAQFGLKCDQRNVRFLDPFGFCDFLKLEESAFCVLSDSGTVQEECAILGIPNVTLRDVTERPETIECGSNILAGVAADSVVRCVDHVIARKTTWKAPPEYLVPYVSDTVQHVLLGFQQQ